MSDENSEISKSASSTNDQEAHAVPTNGTIVLKPIVMRKESSNSSNFSMDLNTIP